MQDIQALEDEVYVLREEVKALRAALKVNTVEASWQLTRKERQVFEVLRPETLITTEQLLRAVYAERLTEDELPASKILTVFISHLRAKLYAGRAPWWLRTAWGDGFVLHTATVEQTRRLWAMPGHRFHRGPKDLPPLTEGTA